MIQWELTRWEVDLLGVDLVGVDLVGVDLVGVDFVRVDLVGLTPKSIATLLVIWLECIILTLPTASQINKTETFSQYLRIYPL